MPFEVPRGADRDARLSSVLEVIYLIFNEGLLGDRRRRLDAAGTLRRRAAARSHPRRARAAGSRGARPRRADGDSGVALARPCRARRASRSCSSIRIVALGSAADPPRARRPRPRRDARRRARSVCAAGRDRRLSRAARAGRRPTGRASPRSTRRWRRSRRRRSSSSTARSPSGWRSVPRRGSPIVDALARRSRPWRTTTFCPASAAICSSKLGRHDEARAEFARAASADEKRAGKNVTARPRTVRLTAVR